MFWSVCNILLRSQCVSSFLMIDQTIKGGLFVVPLSDKKLEFEYQACSSLAYYLSDIYYLLIFYLPILPHVVSLELSTIK